jgi:hypothetical protein
MYPIPIIDAEWKTGNREVGLITQLDLPSDCRKACEETNEDI